MDSTDSHSSSSEDLPEPPVQKEDLVAKLAAAINNKKSTYCCGGNIPIEADLSDDEHKEKLSSAPIVIRWDRTDNKHIGRLTLPSPTDNGYVDDLVKDCTPATFGHNGKEVLDESYRQAVKLDGERFCTTFHPYDLGIIGVISQALIPGIAKATQTLKYTSGKEVEKDLSAWPERYGITAELYKLNVYSGPSGRFKSHVDTPRSATQFGSLVVCLPCPHQGGDLCVSHNGEDTVFNFGSKSANCISWAAFYSDAEHEVLEVTHGHRITLTYNLFVNERIGPLALDNSIAQPDLYALFQTAQTMWLSPDFLPKGGTLGFYCRHAYAHTNIAHIGHLSHALKGLDLVIYSVFRHLGCKVLIKPVLDQKNIWDDDDDDDYDDDAAYDEDRPIVKRETKLIGTCLHALKLDDNMAGDEYQVEDTWKGNWRKHIEWLNEQGPKELAMVQLTYGNKPGMAWHYSFAAIFIVVPDFKTRSAAKASEADATQGKLDVDS